MLVAITNTGHPGQTQTATINGSPAGGQTGYTLGFVVTWADSDSQVQGGTQTQIFVPQGTKRSHFNQMVVDALVAAVNTSSGLVLDPINLYFTPFDNGSLK